MGDPRCPGSAPLSPDTARSAPMRSVSTGARSIDESCHWFHGSISRQQAEDLLREYGNREGLFLVREALSSPGDYAISAIHNGAPAHYQVRRHGDDAFFSVGEQETNRPFHGLEELIREFRDENGSLICEHMCKGQAPPYDTRRHGRSNLLHRAVNSGEFNLVERLLGSNYNIDAKNENGQTALHLACLKGSDNTVLSLLRAKASTHCLDGEGFTPLHYACREGHLECARNLLRYGACTAIASLGKRWVAMHFAAEAGRDELVKLLLSHGAAIRPRSEAKELPVDLVPAHRRDLIQYLQTMSDPCDLDYRREDWFHGELARTEAEARLRRAGDGAFLLRISRKNEVSRLVLSTVYREFTHHYELMKEGIFYFIDDGPLLASPEALIWYYSNHNDGLPTLLTYPVQPVRTPVFNPSRQNGQQAPPRGHFAIASLIPKDHLELMEQIGQGEYGAVLKAIWCKPDGPIVVAVKTLREEHSTREKRDGFVQEVEMMFRLDHPCIVKLLGVSLGPPLMMVQEIVELGSLLDFLVNERDDVDVEMDFPRWLQQVADGMSYLESRQLVHRDLAARNILLASRSQAKISDFGLSRALQVGDNYYRASTGGKWPLKWYAPESINYGNFSPASDVWGFGVTLWEVYSFGEIPYGNMTGLEVLRFVESGSRLGRPAACPDWAYEVMLACWELKRENRPRFGELAQFFKDKIYSDVDGVTHV